MRLVDFQVYAGPSSLSFDDQAVASRALFSTFEPVRLWLKGRKLSAPFRKILIGLVDEATWSRANRRVISALGICEATEAVDVGTLAQSAGDHRWVLRIVGQALARIERVVGWRSNELLHLLDDLAEKALPLVHFFDALACRDRKTGLRCVPWLSTRPGETSIGVRIGERDEVVFSMPGPLYMEDDLPLARAVIRGRELVLLDKTGSALRTVPIERDRQDLAAAAIRAGRRRLAVVPAPRGRRPPRG